MSGGKVWSVVALRISPTAVSVHQLRGEEGEIKMSRWVLRFVDGSMIEIEREEGLADFSEKMRQEARQQGAPGSIPAATFLGSGRSNMFNQEHPKAALVVWDKLVSIVEC